MKYLETLPQLPNHKMKINTLSDVSTGFLSAKSANVDFKYSNNTTKTTTIDYIDRKNGSLDAVTICAWVRKLSRTYIYLRSCIRPALDLRDWSKTGRLENQTLNQWELPAGIIESTETGTEGVQKAASREFKEEIGIYVNPEYFTMLGHPMFSSVGISGERVYFVKTEAHPKYLEKATLDGSAMELNGDVVLVNIQAVISAINDGIIKDTKTILGVMRLYENS
jgi:8-oxo-dGTP pyrophosphatase MutT (NUDIX family)